MNGQHYFLFLLCIYERLQVSSLPCIEVYSDESLSGRFDVSPWDSHWITNPNPWSKTDFIEPYCHYCKCQDRIPDAKMLTRSWKLSEVLKSIELNANYPVPTKKFILNYGAADYYGGVADPTFDLFDDPTNGGLLIDGQTSSELFRKYPKRDNLIIAMGVNIKLSEAITYLEQHSVPKHLTVVKIDIDSFECSLVSLLLEHGYYSLIYHIEFNPTMVPPIRFQPTGTDDSEYDARLWESFTPFYGCSLSSLADILVPAGYHIIEVDGWDATFVHSSVAHIFEPIPSSPQVGDQIGFRNRFNLFPCYQQAPKLYNAETLRLSMDVRTAKKNKDSQELHKAMHALHELFTQFAPKHKESHQPFPFYLANEGPSDIYYFPLTKTNEKEKISGKLHEKLAKHNFTNHVCLAV